MWIRLQKSAFGSEFEVEVLKPNVNVRKTNLENRILKVVMKKVRNVCEIVECRNCRTDGWWDQQGHKILAWTQIVSRQSASLCSFNSEKFILCNLLLPADIVDKVSLVYSLLIEHLLWHCVTTWALQRHMAGHVLVAGSSVEGLDRVVGPGTMVPPGTSQTPPATGPDRFSRWKCNLQGKTLPAY